eukprot:TRINITY_DN19365_c2_g1_i1.p1 TRINITY_DN19365_c2_g1~~TRINITY_DN19365_c2_g1_i1.p1  ORF type:complete len:234 (-),score=41.68 TRINITY_DN19365_c2_g1_i1:132-833(-)
MTFSGQPGCQKQMLQRTFSKRFRVLPMLLLAAICSVCGRHFFWSSLASVLASGSSGTAQDIDFGELTQAKPKVAAVGGSSCGNGGGSGAKQFVNLTGTWYLQRTENQGTFMRAIGYSFLLAKGAAAARVTQTIFQNETGISFIFEVVPPLLTRRRESFIPYGAEEVFMTDDGGREMMLICPSWEGKVFRSGLRYIDPEHEMNIDRYLDEDGFMVEYVQYLGMDVEMKRIFSKA